MKNVIALTAFALFVSAPVAQSKPVATQELRATDFSSLKEVDPKPQDKSKARQLRKSKGGPSSGAGEVMIKEVDPAPQGKLRGIKAGKSKGGPSSGAEEVGFKEVDPKPQDKTGNRSGKGKGGASSGADEVGFNPQPDPPGIDKKKLSKKTLGEAPPPDGDKGGTQFGPSPHMNSQRLDTPRFGVPSLGGAGGARVR